MSYKRRDFLKLTGGLAMTGLVADKALSSLLNDSDEVKMKSFGLQLYSVRDDLKEGDPKDILKQVADAGYNYIESFEGDKGMFWGMSNTEFKKYVEGLGMKIVSSHCDISKDFQKKADDAAAIGMKYLICPWEDEQKTVDAYKKIAEEFNNCGQICKKNGMRFAYHNHDQDFKTVEGQIAEDIYMQNTDPDLVDFEMDIYWVITAGQDPEAWLKKYSPRYRLCHIKDRIKGATERDASCDLGMGSIDFQKILKTAKQHGTKYYIVEQERYDNTTPLKSMVADADYLKKFKF